MKQLDLFAAWDPLAHDCAAPAARRGGLDGLFVLLLPRPGGARRGELHAPDVHAGVERLEPRTCEPRYARLLCRRHARFDGSPTLAGLYGVWKSTGPWGLELTWISDVARAGHLLHETPCDLHPSHRRRRMGNYVVTRASVSKDHSQA